MAWHTDGNGEGVAILPLLLLGVFNLFISLLLFFVVEFFCHFLGWVGGGGGNGWVV